MAASKKIVSSNKSNYSPFKALGKPKKLWCDGKPETSHTLLLLDGKKYFIVSALSGKRERFKVFESRSKGAGMMRSIIGIDGKKFSSVDRKSGLITTLQRLSRNNGGLPTILDLHRSRNGRIYVVTPWLEGITLEKYLSSVSSRKGNYWGTWTTCNIMKKLAHTLFHLHKYRIIHGDINPKNIIWQNQPENCLSFIDFGSAWLVEHTTSRDFGDGVNLEYAAPELILKENFADERSDQFSFGTIWYRMLTFKLPYAGYSGKFVQPQYAVHREEIESSYKPPSYYYPERKSLPKDLVDLIDKIVGRCLKIAPEERYSSPKEFIKDFYLLDKLLRADSELTPTNEALLSRIEDKKSLSEKNKKISFLQKIIRALRNKLLIIFDWLESLFR